MKRRKNPDESIRDLERRARQGDRAAGVKVLVDRFRHGLPLIRVIAAADLGCSEAEEAYEAVMGRRLTKMSFTDQIAQAYHALDDLSVYGILLELARQVIGIFGVRDRFHSIYLRHLDRLSSFLLVDGPPWDEPAIQETVDTIMRVNPGDMRGIALYTLAFNRITYPANRGGLRLDAVVMSTTDLTNSLQGHARDAARQWLKERLIQELLA
jgi:hypothetical protein